MGFSSKRGMIGGSLVPFGTDGEWRVEVRSVVRGGWGLVLPVADARDVVTALRDHRDALATVGRISVDGRRSNPVVTTDGGSARIQSGDVEDVIAVLGELLRAVNASRTGNAKKTKQWREARVQSYIETRSAESLARMLVDLEDCTNSPAEFDIDDDWPTQGKVL